MTGSFNLKSTKKVGSDQWDRQYVWRDHQILGNECGRRARRRDFGATNTK
jgi:hypothetical protein